MSEEFPEEMFGNAPAGEDLPAEPLGFTGDVFGDRVRAVETSTIPYVALGVGLLIAALAFGPGRKV